MNGQRGFGTLELLVATAIFAGLLFVTASNFGMRAPRLHADALALQAALGEARALAMALDAGSPDSAAANVTGATVTVSADGAGGSSIAVYRSRPIPGAQNPTVDEGFPPVRVGSTFAVKQTASGSVLASGTFAILVSSSGYASVVPAYSASPGSFARLRTDPGCYEAGASIEARSGAYSESHAFHCREAIYDASSAPA